MSSFNRYIPDDYSLDNIEGQGLTINDDQNLKGNLEEVDENNLVKAEPKDLKVGETYLLINNDTNEKTFATYDNYEEGENEENFSYIFKDKDGKLEVNADNITNSDPYNPLITFDNNISVFIPQTKKIMEKMLREKIPEDTAKEVASYLNYGGKIKKNKKSLKNMIKSKKRRIKNKTKKIMKRKRK
jgi:hypothetical protein